MAAVIVCFVEFLLRERRRLHFTLHDAAEGACYGNWRIICAI